MYIREIEETPNNELTNGTPTNKLRHPEFHLLNTIAESSIAIFDRRLRQKQPYKQSETTALPYKADPKGEITNRVKTRGEWLIKNALNSKTSLFLS